jgi:hypothetical protein
MATRESLQQLEQSKTERSDVLTRPENHSKISDVTRVCECRTRGYGHACVFRCSRTAPLWSSFILQTEEDTVNGERLSQTVRTGALSQLRTQLSNPVELAPHCGVQRSSRRDGRLAPTETRVESRGEPKRGRLDVDGHCF